MSLPSPTPNSHDFSDVGGDPEDLHKKIGQLQSATQKWKDVEFPMVGLRDILTRLQDFLDLCKKTEGSKPPIERFTNLLKKFFDNVLDPILKEKQQGQVEISKVLIRKIRSLAIALLDAIPEKRLFAKLPFLGWMFNNVDIDSILASANPKIDSALQTFLNNGNIRCEVRTVDNCRILDIGKKNENIIKVIQGRRIPWYCLPWDGGDSGPVTHRVLESLPRFRILLLGKSQTGKSSIISNIFGIPLADVASVRPTGADITTEITSPINPYIIFHDSLGYESESIENFWIVENFIKQRSQKDEISDQIHAIWLCTEVPLSGAHIFDVVDERLFGMNIRKAPLILLFTKYDTLVFKKAKELFQNLDIPENAFAEAVKVGAEKEFRNLCQQPLFDLYGTKMEREDLPPSTQVSVKPGYEDTLFNVVQITRNCVAQLFDFVDRVPPSTLGSRYGVRQYNATAWLTWAIAQRADADISVEASIAIGRQKFWRDLGSSTHFQGKTLKYCLDTLHEDIVLVWNFYDHNGLLTSDLFKAMMVRVIGDLVIRDKVEPNSAHDALTEIPGAVNPLAITGEPRPIDKWLDCVYRQTPELLRCLMAYIVDLTVIMRELCRNVREKGGFESLSEELVCQAFEWFSGSKSRVLIHTEIGNFIDRKDITGKAKDGPFDEVVRLISKYCPNHVESSYDCFLH